MGEGGEGVRRDGELTPQFADGGGGRCVNQIVNQSVLGSIGPETYCREEGLYEY